MAIQIENLNNLHIDVFKEIGNIGAGNAATALAKMMDRKVDMAVPKVKIIDFRNISDILGGAETPVIGILLNVEGDISGSIMFIMEQHAAKKLVSLLMGQIELEVADVAFNEMEMSALQEVGNILAGSYLSSLSTLTGLKIYPYVPAVAIDMAGAILSVPAIEFGKTGDAVLYIENEFIEGETSVIGDFFLIPEMDSYEILLRALGVVS